MKKWTLFTVGILGILLITCWGILTFFREPSSFKKNNCYFSVVPITKWTDGLFPTPCLTIQIGSKTISSELDLGFRGHLSLSSETLDQINDKKYLKLKKMYGYGGKEYEKKVFEIPEVRIGPLSLYHVLAQEEAKDFRANGTIIQGDEVLSQAELGRIGWEIFQISNLLLDLGNKTIAFCDSLSTLKRKGYEIESFVKTPLISERGLIEIDAITSNGKLRCVLDTGSTWNILNGEIEEGKLIEPSSSLECPLFVLGGKEFGPINFHHIPVQLPIHIEAILGMEFFNKNLVFFDFTNNMLYFSPSG